VVIRRTPEDFRVVEVLRPEALARVTPAQEGVPPGRRGLYLLTKRSVTTLDATGAMGRALEIGTGAVRHAGLKDKHALTVQHVLAPAGERALPASVEGPGWSAKVLGLIEGDLTAGDIDRNDFVITVRGLSRASNQRLSAHIRARLGRDATGTSIMTLVNAFGAQRFGSARAGEGWVARKLIEGDFVGALKLAIATPHRKDSGVQRDFARAAAKLWGAWGEMLPLLPACPQRAAIEALAAGRPEHEAYAALPHFLQELHVDAYQSWIWNHAAALASGASVDAEGVLHQPAPELVRSLAARLAASGGASAELPTASPELDAGHEFAPLVLKVLAGEGLEPPGLVIPQLRRPRFEGYGRALLVRAEGFAMDKAEGDELAEVPAAGEGAGAPVVLKRVLRFSLPSGSYATVVLGAIEVW